mmetsp:Transcript_90778/g.261573  ORF Transcript_90778/g.261573 Transcript_90778/m.261573 type:complete len:103 (-) Transcript_90778:3-311(-)
MRAISSSPGPCSERDGRSESWAASRARRACDSGQSIGGRRAAEPEMGRLFAARGGAAPHAGRRERGNEFAMRARPVTLLVSAMHLRESARNGARQLLDPFVP